MITMIDSSFDNENAWESKQDRTPHPAHFFVKIWSQNISTATSLPPIQENMLPFKSANESFNEDYILVNCLRWACQGTVWLRRSNGSVIHANDTTRKEISAMYILFLGSKIERKHYYMLPHQFDKFSIKNKSRRFRDT